MSAAGTTGAVIIALICNLAIAALKVTACTMTGSAVMLSEAIHSLVGTSSQALLLLGLKRAHHDAPGPSPELYFWSYIAAILLFAMGAGVALAVGVNKFLHPQPIDNTQFNYAVLFVALAVSGVSAYKILREFDSRRGAGTVLAALRSARDPALFTIVLQALAALTGLLIALTGLIATDKLGMAGADGFASILIGFLLAAIAAFMSIEVRNVIEHGGIEHGVTPQSEKQMDAQDALLSEPSKIANVIDAARDGVRLATSAPQKTSTQPSRKEKKHAKK